MSHNNFSLVSSSKEKEFREIGLEVVALTLGPHTNMHRPFYRNLISTVLGSDGLKIGVSVENPTTVHKRSLYPLYSNKVRKWTKKQTSKSLSLHNVCNLPHKSQSRFIIEYMRSVTFYLNTFSIHRAQFNTWKFVQKYFPQEIRIIKTLSEPPNKV